MKINCWCGGTINNVAEPPHCNESTFHDPFADGRRLKHTTLYIAGPMSGYPDSNYPAFNEAAGWLEGAGYTIVNPATDVVGNERHYTDFIREDLRMMLDCHGVATLENWWESTGARNEVSVAGILKMPVRTVADWLERSHHELS